MLRSGETFFEYERDIQPRPKLGRWTADLEELLVGNAAKPAREQLTLIRVFEELRGHGYDGGYDAVKARGVRLGRHGAEVLAPKYREEARQRATQLKPIITELKGKGYSMARIATELNKRKVVTPRGGRCDHSSVRNVLNRLQAA